MKFFFIFSFFVLVLLFLPVGDADATDVCNDVYYEDGVGWVKECPVHCSSNTGKACTKSNACDTNWGTYDCGGVCIATEPDPVPSNYGNPCKNTNACGTTGTFGTIGCDGKTCSGSTPATPYTVGTACTSTANACGSTSGSISDACKGTCSPPGTPYSATSCTSTANACGSTSGTTDICTGACTPPATPFTVGNSCTSTANNVGSTSGTISDACKGTCAPPADATISVSVSTSPTSGTAPLKDVAITGNAGGTATGDITYKLDCTNDGTYEQEITNSTDPYTFTTKCSYSTAGSYTPKVHVTRQKLTASNTATVTVWGVSLAADPSGTVKNTTSVKYTATASSTVLNTIYYIRIYEGTTQQASCGSGTTCTYSTSDSDRTRSFVAKVETYTAGTVIVTSDTVSTTWGKTTTQLPDSDFYFDPTTIVQGNSTTVRGWLKTSSETGIGGKTISLQCWDGTSWPEVVSGTTETASPNIGYTSFSWTPTSSWNGDISCRLDFAGDAIYASSTSGLETITVTPAEQCAAPQNLSCTYNSEVSLTHNKDTLSLSWSAITGVTSYFMEWARFDKPYGDKTDITGTTSGTVGGSPGDTSKLTAGKTYKLHVRADAVSGSACSVPGAFSADIECYTGTCKKNSTPRTDSFTIPVQTSSGTKNCSITATHSGRDLKDSSSVFYQETACQADPAASSSNIQDVACQTNTTTNSSTIAMDDNPSDVGCQDNLVFTNAFGIQGTGVLNVIGEANSKRAGNDLAFGYRFTTSECVIMGVQANTAWNVENAADNSYLGGPIIEADKKAASLQQAVYADTDTVKKISDFGFTLKECTQDSHCSADPNKTYCNGGVTRTTSNFPLNTCIDSVPPTITIGEIKRTHSGLLGSKTLLATPETPGTDSVGRQWLRDGKYEISINVQNNVGGSGVDTSYRPVMIRSIGADDVFGPNPITGIDDDKKYSLTRSAEDKFSVWVGSSDSLANDCVKQGDLKCRIEVYARDLAGNETLLFPRPTLNIDYTPPSAQ